MQDLQPGAAHSPASSRTRHMRRLEAYYVARRSSRVVKRASRGQTLIIFVLTFTVLIGFMGLAIDSVRLYDLYARMERAAEAGALAGVIYMPNNYITNVPAAPNDNAVCRAEKEVFKDGFGSTCTDPAAIPGNPCPTPKSSLEVAVCKTGLPYQLQVSVTESINMLFLSALNVGPLTITASATAAYLPPVEIASDPTGTGTTSSWGSFGECGNSGTSASGACTGKTNVRNWSGNVNGPGELKEQGDPLVTCAEGPGSPVTADTAVTASTPPSIQTYVGMPTNHPQTTAPTPGQVPPNCGNSDAQYAFTGPMYTGANAPLRAGYAFYVHIPSAIDKTDPGYPGVAQNVWVWNAPFSPSTPKNCNGRTGGQSGNSYDIFYEYNCGGSSSTPYPYYPGVTGVTTAGANCASGSDPYACLNPDLYFSVTYSIYSLSGATDITGSLAATFTVWPYAGQGSCPSGQYAALPAISQPFAGVGGLSTTGITCLPSPCVVNWCPIANQLGDIATPSTLWPGYTMTPGGYYRVMVVTSDYGHPGNLNMGWGGHSFSMKLCPASGTAQSNVQTCDQSHSGILSGWNESDTLFIFPGGGGGSTQITEYPLGVINSSFAGRTIDVRMYDPGDLSGNNTSLKGTTFYAVAPPTAASDPCAATTTDLSNAGYTSSNFVFSANERTSTLNSLPALEPSLKGDLIYNGLWVDEQVTVPTNYQYANSTWTLCAQAPQTNDADVLAIGTFALGQSPVHLVN